MHAHSRTLRVRTQVCCVLILIFLICLVAILLIVKIVSKFSS
jgi:hypothetical protein